MRSKKERALELFKENFNCAQSVLAAFCEELGLGADTALRLAGGFGGGLRCGEVCGAVTGAAMVIGLRHGHCVPGDQAQKLLCNKKISEFMELYAATNGSCVCRELLGYDMRDERARLANREKHFTVCPPLIASAVELLESGEFI